MIEASDCVIAIGANMSDWSTGGFTTNLQVRHLVDIKLNITKVKKARFEDVRSCDVVRALAGALRRREGAEAAYWQRRKPQDGVLAVPTATPGAPLLSDAFLAALQRLLRPGDVLVMETCTAGFAAVSMRIPSGVDFISQGLWGSIGFAAGAAGGATRALAALGAAGRRVVLVTGEGALQMTAPVLADMLRDGLAPLCFVINNDGCAAALCSPLSPTPDAPNSYLIERLLCKRANSMYNDIPVRRTTHTHRWRAPLLTCGAPQMWLYAELPRVFGAPPERFHAATVAHADELAPAIAAAEAAQTEGRLAWVELKNPRLDVPRGAAWMLPEGFPDVQPQQAPR